METSRVLERLERVQLILNCFSQTHKITQNKSCNYPRKYGFTVRNKTSKRTPAQTSLRAAGGAAHLSATPCNDTRWTLVKAKTPATVSPRRGRLILRRDHKTCIVLCGYWIVH
jgi:hypothetical protein